jgi:hypothetical protein
VGLRYNVTRFDEFSRVQLRLFASFPQCQNTRL